MTAGSPDPLLAWRSEFPILEQTAYLISNSLGAMPRAVYDALRSYADTWATLGVRAWATGAGDAPSWWELKRAVGDLIAPLLGAPPGSVLMQESASFANAQLISALDFNDPRRDTVVVSDQDFPSDVYSIAAMLPSHMRVVTVPSRDGIAVETEDLLAAIDERTRLVALSHVLFRSAYIVPAAAIIERAHRVGAQVLLNGYHSVGVIPVDVTALRVDFYVGGTLKWLCGGPGGVFIYIRPDLLPALHPRITGWFAHPRPFAFETQFALRDDIYRLATGTPAIPALYAVQPGVRIIRQIGIDAIRAKSIRQTGLILELADQAGYAIHSPRRADQRGGTVTVRPDHAYAVSRELLARGFTVDYREGAGIRIAPHFYTSDDEIRACFDAMADILQTGAWRQHADDRAFVT
ncbi:MAG: aminotransferase class V-fold PLP-dependent enzyme [Anaerolinea sp.]|nr:aminotransferase class V-fold PLP-dependent enzyme [Anaerolinea sp.]